MPLNYNGTNITAINYNGTSLTQIVYNGTVVWTAAPTYQWVYYGTESIEQGLDLTIYGTFNGSVLSMIQYLNNNFPPGDFPGNQAEVYDYSTGIYYLFESMI